VPGQQNKNRDSQILQRLGEWKQREESLPQFVELYGRLLQFQVEVRALITVAEPDLSEETVFNQLRQGIPLLEFDDLLLDWTLVQDYFHKVIDILAEYVTEEMRDTRTLKDLASDVPVLQQVIRDWYQGSPLSSIAARHRISEQLLTAAIQFTLRPFLMSHSEVLVGLVNQDLWRLRKCPICGGRSDFACLDKEQGARWLLCSRCDARWLFQRLECPYCGTQNKDDLAYFTDDKELYRLYTCQRCNSYIKAIDLRKADDKILLPLERVMTVDLDRQAEEKGYVAGWLDRNTPI